MENYFLASSNTTDGFCNHFDSINPGENSFTYVIKGGSGTGKSTFMKKIGSYFKDKGYDIEYFFCSSDPNSLDGVRILGKNVALVDGTSPHVTEATLPGVKDKILNVGEFISKDIKKYKLEIEKLLPKKKMMFDMCYKYLGALKSIVEIEKLLVKGEKYSEYVLSKSKEVLEGLKLKSSKLCKKRALYLSCVDSGGLKNLIDKNGFERVINLDSKNYILGFDVMSKITEKLDSKKVEYIKFLSPLGKDLIEGVYIKNEKLLIFNNLQKGSLKNEYLFNFLLKKSGKCVEDARKIHKKIEKYYIKNMDFARLTVLREKVVQEIENM